MLLLSLLLLSLLLLPLLLFAAAAAVVVVVVLLLLLVTSWTEGRLRSCSSNKAMFNIKSVSDCFDRFGGGGDGAILPSGLSLDLSQSLGRVLDLSQSLNLALSISPNLSPVTVCSWV